MKSTPVGLSLLSLPLSSTIAAEVTASIGMGGFIMRVHFQQSGANVYVNTERDFARWQVHELPVDYSVEPKLRCRPEYVGRLLHYRGKGNYIYNATTASLVMHSVVLYEQGQPVACAPITPFSLPSFAASVVFKSGLFGKIVFLQWQSGENSA